MTVAVTTTAIAAIGILLGSSLASAESVERVAPSDPSSAAPREPSSIDVIATQPLALVARGLAISYEHLVWPRASLVALGGARAAANGDYDSFTWTLGAEARYWPLSTAMRRLFVGLHLSAGHTSVTDNIMHTTAGTAWGLTQRLDVGYRFVIGGHVTLTPALGLALREDVDTTGRLATTARPAVMLGFELGWMQRGWR